MMVESHEPLQRIAAQVANCFAESGYAFIEDDQLDGLVVQLEAFLAVAGIAVNPPGANDRTSGDESLFADDSGGS